MSQIYKLGYIVNNEIRGIYVFSGLRKRLHDRDINMNELYVSDRDNKIFENIFSPEEQQEIDEKEAQRRRTIAILGGATAVALGLAAIAIFFFLRSNQSLETANIALTAEAFSLATSEAAEAEATTEAEAAEAAATAEAEAAEAEAEAAEAEAEAEAEAVDAAATAESAEVDAAATAESAEVDAEATAVNAEEEAVEAEETPEASD